MKSSSIVPGNLIVFAEKSSRSDMKGHRFPLIEVQWEDVEWYTHPLTVKVTQE